MSHKITLMPGDGIGPEITESVIQIIEAAGVSIEWDKQIAGIKAMEEFGDSVPEKCLDSIKKNKVALKGPLTTLVGKGFRSANVTLRKTLDLYANVRPVKTIDGVPSRYENIDLVIIRENTEDLYAGIENIISPGVTQTIKVVTKSASDNIARFAFEYAKANNRKRITIVHKANIMKITDGLFLSSFEEIAKEYPEIQADDKIVDALCMNIVMNPSQFDMLLLGNMFGDIVSDLAAGLVGGLGVVPGANLGKEYAVFEAVHGSAPDIAGENIANPTALMFSALMMLRHIGEKKAADIILESMMFLFAGNKEVTKDLGGNLSTTEFTEVVIREVKSRL